MLKGLNSFLRIVFFLFGGLFLLGELLPERKALRNDREGFDREEYDDIW
jgi:hypothetical protein